jgi:dolichyl-phosphate beta-glucosyltransferase
MSRTTLVVPCYNEAARFDAQSFGRALTDNPGLDLLFVDDGSSDDTASVLELFKEKHRGRVRLLTVERNQGKAHAVRVGMLEAFDGDINNCDHSDNCDHCGYWDADLATPLEEIPRFVEMLEVRPDLELVIGSRVKLLGRSIERDPMRHYLGRIAATVASLLLDLPVYDTQCGAKLFRNTPAMKALFREPLTSGWVFDVEIIARMIRDRRDAGLPSAESVIYELPLLRWHDVAGSKIRLADYAHALIDVIRVYRRTLRR